MAAGGEIGGDVRAGGISDRTPARTTNSEAAGAAAMFVPLRRDRAP